MRVSKRVYDVERFPAILLSYNQKRHDGEPTSIR